MKNLNKSRLVSLYNFIRYCRRNYKYLKGKIILYALYIISLMTASLDWKTYQKLDAGGE